MLTRRILCKALIWQRESPWICKGFILHLFNLGFIHHAVNFPVGYTGYYALIVNEISPWGLSGGDVCLAPENIPRHFVVCMSSLNKDL